MAVNDNIFITRGNDKTFPFDLKYDDGKPAHDLADAMFEFVVKDMEGVEVLRLVSGSGDIEPNVPDHSMVSVRIQNALSGALDPGMYRYALQGRWLDGRTHEWVFPRVLHVFADMVT